MRSAEAALMTDLLGSGAGGRALGSFESAAASTHQVSPFVVVAVVRLEPGPSDQALRRALDTMQARAPLLRVRVLDVSSRARFASDGTPPIPLDLRSRFGDEAWKAVAEEALNHRLDVAVGPLLRVTYLRGGPASGPAEIVLEFLHTIVDASSGQHFLDELLTLCADPRAALPATDPALPPPADALVPDAFRGIPGQARRAGYMIREVWGELRHRLASRRIASTPGVPPTATCRILPRELGPEATAALIQEARDRGMTLNSVLNAALLLALWRTRYREQPMTMQALAFADLRPYLCPPASPQALACYIAMLRLPVAVRPGLGLWELAQSFQERLYAAARRGEKFLANIATQQLMRVTLRSRRFRMAHTALSYAGSTRLRAAYGSMRVRGLHGFVSDIPMGPEFTALARLAGDRILWDFLYLGEDMDRAEAERMAGDVLECLETGARPAAARRPAIGG